MNRYLFDYRHGDATYGIEIVAASADEACARIKSVASARYRGCLHVSVPVPGAASLLRLIRRLRGAP